MRRRSLMIGAGLLAAPGLAVARDRGGVNVLYAGSLVNLMERGIGPAFEAATGDRFEGFAGGSSGLANQVRGRLRQGDVFISASPAVDRGLIGAADGAWLRWYITFARSALVIGFNPASRFAAALKTRPWYAVLQEPGIRIGRTDPRLDPKGMLTVRLLEQAARIHKIPGLARQVLGAPENPGQVLPEENLIGRLQSRQIDAGFFYATETSDLRIPAIVLPQEVAVYATYTVAILDRAPNPEAAARFVAFLLGAQAGAVMRNHGLDVLAPRAAGEAGAIPASVRKRLDPAG